jgi:predicted metal-dependent hydrolase
LRDRRRRILDAFYRKELKARAAPLIAKWGERLHVRAENFFVQRMKTRWGSSNPRKRTIGLNLELAKRAPECLDYVVLHELAHFIARRHNDQFTAILDHCMPGWRFIRDKLNEGPLGPSNG